MPDIGYISQSAISSLELDSDNGYISAILQHPNNPNIYIICHLGGTGATSGIRVSTISVTDGGTLAAIDNALIVACTAGGGGDIVWVEVNIFALFYMKHDGAGTDGGAVSTVTINTNGSITKSGDQATLLDTYFPTSSGTGQQFVPGGIHVAGTTYAMAYVDTSADGRLETITISTAGLVTDTPLDNWEFETTDCRFPYIMQIDGSVFAITHGISGTNGKINTVDIAADGTLSDGAGGAPPIDYRGSIGVFNSRAPLINIADTYYAIFWGDSGGDAQVATHAITNAGSIGSRIGIWEFDTAGTIYYGNSPSAVVVADNMGGDGKVFFVSHEFSSTDNLKSFEISDVGVITGSFISTATLDSATAFSTVIAHTRSIYIIVYRGPDSAGSAWPTYADLWVKTFRVLEAGGMELMSDGLKARLETISDIARVFAANELPNVINEFPVALILPGETEYNQSFTNKIDVLFRVLILVAKQDNPSAYNRLLDYMQPLGGDSVYAAISGDQTLGGAADAAFVTKCSGAGATIWGGQTYLSTEFEVVAYG